MNIFPLFLASHHPVIISPTLPLKRHDVCIYLQGHNTLLKRLILDHGAVLLRGFPIQGADDFRAVVASLGLLAYNYVGGNSPHTRMIQDVYSSTEYPASEVISLHNEMSYLHKWPQHLLFYSAIPSRMGGQTSLANGRDVLRAMPDEILYPLVGKKINYQRHFPSGINVGKSWQATYQTEDRDEVGEIITAQGSTCSWDANGSLHTSTICDAIIRHPKSGEEVWFNQAEQWHPSSLNSKVREAYELNNMIAHSCQFGNGDPMDDQILAQIRTIQNQHKLLFNWKTNDLLILDNIAMMHGRESFSGVRKTLVYLSEN